MATKTPWLHGFAAFFTNAGVWLLVVGVLVLGWWFRREHRALAGVLLVLAGTVVAYGASELIKSWVSEPRPCRALPVPPLAVTCPGVTDFSFPSNHSTVVAALAVGLWFVSRRLGVAATVLALAVGFSRVYVGAHYPHDVVVGLLLGGVVAALAQSARGVVTTMLRRLPPSTRSAAQPR